MDLTSPTIWTVGIPFCLLFQQLPPAGAQADPLSAMMESIDRVSKRQHQREVDSPPAERASIEQMRGLFPGPLVYGGKAGQHHALDEPDPLVLEMISGVQGPMREHVIPQINGTYTQEPRSCRLDVHS
eukprot:TRINITY_DN105833_c0_g1_i1.p1 TRINITY_DN105833_c0_g1~~TRINITY_DN105833_c0_g1_i1.p1  ORF type:complete len:128 (+),score=5.07 TRINITY_DN105833_c0_g1_i1:81-464(+)